MPSFASRRSVRLPEYDYSIPGAYFVTICAYNRQCLFGRIADHKVKLNRLGEIASEELAKTATIRTNVRIAQSIVMPNHVHAIMVIASETEWTQRAASLHEKFGPGREFGGLQPGSLHAIVRAYKSAVTKSVHGIARIGRIWQPRFYEHVIRNEAELRRTREYILKNPVQWELEREYPNRVFGVSLE